MQVLYATCQDSELTEAKALRYYEKTVNESFKTLLFDLYVFTRVLKESRLLVKLKANKHRPTEDDLNFRSHAYDNPLILSLANSSLLSLNAEESNIEDLLDEETLRKFYITATEVEGYTAYSTKETPTHEEHLDFILKAHKALITNEVYIDFIEDSFSKWKEDSSLVIGSAKKVLKSLPAQGGFLMNYRPDAEIKNEFGKHLLVYVLENNEVLESYIKPILKNWDLERVAVLDNVLIKMAIAEFIEFKQIPPKVTLNEYVELAKTYSTDKSKEFINGILDKLLHTLSEEGLIVKEGRGLVD